MVSEIQDLSSESLFNFTKIHFSVFSVHETNLCELNDQHHFYSKIQTSAVSEMNHEVTKPKDFMKFEHPLLTFTFSMSSIETLGKGVEYVPS